MEASIRYPCNACYAWSPCSYALPCFALLLQLLQPFPYPSFPIPDGKLAYSAPHWSVGSSTTAEPSPDPSQSLSAPCPHLLAHGIPWVAVLSGVCQCPRGGGAPQSMGPVREKSSWRQLARPSVRLDPAQWPKVPEDTYLHDSPSRFFLLTSPAFP
jgi:hypothetical protein